MTLPQVFVSAFFGVLALAAVGAGLGKGIIRITDWLKVRTGRSETLISFTVFAVMMALLFAISFTVLVARNPAIK